MTIAIGTRLGPFELVDLIGEGGMGAVYRARDTRLQRDVAIKILPAAFATDAERLRRFEQEALAAAQLAHPNILAVHDIGTHDGSPYLVTELLDGSTLREKIDRRPMPVRRAVDYATQIARGLAAAHDRGIVHRDVKPENLFVTQEGQIKILDFGVAKLAHADVATGSAADTITMAGSGPLGTAAYMSPEQASGGGNVDHRADLFSLGVVLYEMLTGVSPFRRATAAETMTAILREEAPEFPPDLDCPPALQRTVRHCLEKARAGRFQSARDLAFDLEGNWVNTPGGGPAVHLGPSGYSRRARRSSRYLWPVVAGALLAAGAAGYFAGRASRAPLEPQSFPGIHRLTDFSGLEEFPAIAPDMKSVAFTSRVNNYQQIFVRLVAGGPPLQVTRDSVDHQVPRWSPDASAIFYFSPAAPGDVQGTVWSIPTLGGAPRRVIDSIGGADVGKDGRIACFRLKQDTVELVSAASDGSDVRVIAELDDPGYYKYPRWSPDARWIAYQRGDGTRWDIFVVSSAGGPARQLTQENRQIHGLAWMPDSRTIVYSSSRGSSMPYLPTLALWELAIDGGSPRLVAPGDVSYLHPDVGPDGALVASRLHMRFDVWRYPVGGSAEDNVRRGVAVTRQTAQVQTPTVGANDRDIAFLSDSGGHANLWVLNADTSEIRQITHERDVDIALGLPIWSPDGTRIAFVSSRGNAGLGFGVWVVDPDGANQRQVAAHGLGPAWSLDARWLYFVDDGNVYRVAAEGGAATLVRPGPVRNLIGSDGKTLYFVVDRTLADGSPGFEILAAAGEDGPGRVIAHIRASRAPQWQIINPSLSPDGRALAMPLTDGVTTNIWTLSIATGQWTKVTEFGQRPTFIARRVSWTADSRAVLAAVGEGDADVVLFDRRE